MSRLPLRCSALATSAQSGGPQIDRGLILQRLLEEKGFHLVYREPPEETACKGLAEQL